MLLWSLLKVYSNLVNKDFLNIKEDFFPQKMPQLNATI